MKIIQLLSCFVLAVQAGPSRRLPNHSHRNQSNFDPWEFTDETTSTSNMATRRHKRCLEENDKPESSSSRSNRNPRVAESDQSHPGDIQTHSSQHSNVERSDSNLSEEFGMPVVTTSRMFFVCLESGKMLLIRMKNPTILEV